MRGILRVGRGSILLLLLVLIFLEMIAIALVEPLVIMNSRSRGSLAPSSSCVRSRSACNRRGDNGYG